MFYTSMLYTATAHGGTATAHGGADTPPSSRRADPLDPARKLRSGQQLAGRFKVEVVASCRVKGSKAHDLQEAHSREVGVLAKVEVQEVVASTAHGRFSL